VSRVHSTVLGLTYRVCVCTSLLDRRAPGMGKRQRTATSGAVQRNAGVPAPAMDIDRGGGGGGGAADVKAMATAEPSPAKRTKTQTDANTADAAPPIGPALNERECSRQLNWLWTTARIGLPVSDLNAVIAAYVAAAKRMYVPALARHHPCRVGRVHVPPLLSRFHRCHPCEQRSVRCGCSL
jgi:hypothetical protein